MLHGEFDALHLPRAALEASERLETHQDMDTPQLRVDEKNHGDDLNIVQMLYKKRGEAGE
ncbi:hypothetical protein [Tranquillimonas alkanivorans]|uniref:Uncharacterized protein n=1 Tax=Tranquillimonas alkanivorans TaxID=441119 RepID=A0A1I5X049_9RHOB|nr:hypothetical protein [Tranquillimonas alkanivorans]SFQ25280.1 hypothetical protein SAMN04488047_1702 [Tranquillimonas alkanivorans]